MGVTLRLELDAAAPKERIDHLWASVSNLDPLMDEVGAALSFSTARRFEQGRGPDGRPWTPVRRGGQPLVKDGHLRDSVSHQVGPNRVEIGTTAKSGAVHQFGAVIRPKSAKALAFRVGKGLVMVKQVTIPARPYLGMSAEDDREVEAIAAAHVKRAAEGV